MYEELKRVIPFSEKEYLTPEEIKGRFNLEDVGKVWEKVNEYRSLFRYSFSLKSPSKASYFFTFDRNVLFSLSSLERKAYALLSKYYALSERGKRECAKECDKESISWLNDIYKLNLSQRDVEGIVCGTREDEPKTRILTNYLDTEEKLSSIRVLDDPSLLSKINNSLIGVGEEEPFKVRSQEDGLKGFQSPASLILGQLEDFFSFLRQEEDDLPLFAKLVAGMFQYAYLDPCLYFSDVTGGLLFKAVLAHGGFGQLGFCFPLEGIFFQMTGDLLKKAKVSLKSGDMTYFLLACLPYLEGIVERISLRLDDLTTKDEKWKEEERNLQDKETGPIESLEELSKEKYDSLITHIQYYNQIAYPNLYPNEEIKTNYVNHYSPMKFSKKENGVDPLDEKVGKLLEKYPVLKKSMAHFYLTHQDIGSFYTISQFKAYEGVAYETARTSMDLLTNLGFYDKSKTAKKFVYTPIPKNPGRKE